MLVGIPVHFRIVFLISYPCSNNFSVLTEDKFKKAQSQEDLNGIYEKIQKSTLYTQYRSSIFQPVKTNTAKKIDKLYEQCKAKFSNQDQGEQKKQGGFELKDLKKK